MDRLRIGNSDLISAVNNRLVLQAVRVKQPTYRAEVARHTGLRPATVTTIVNGLLSAKLLTEVDGESPCAPAAHFGRPPLMLQINGDVKRIVAVDLEPDRVRVALTNILVEVLEYREVLVDRFSGHAEVCTQIVALCNEVLAGVPRGLLHGVGVSLPGLIDREGGTLISSTNMPRWQNVPVAAILRKALGVPVRVERSIHLAAMYEKWANPRNDDRTILVVSLRTGVGISLMHRGELITGQRGFDGEIGHTVVDVDGRPCECGSRGCLETFISASAICARAAEAIRTGGAAALASRVAAGEPMRPELIYRLARDGDADSADIVRYVGRYLGIAVCNLINLLAPHEVVICGAIDVAGDLVLDAVREQMEQRVLPRMRERVNVRLSHEQEKLPLLGAAALVAQDWFQLPRLRHAEVEDDLEREIVHEPQ